MLFSVARSALSYHGREAAKDAPVVKRMRELSTQCYRRVRILLGCDGYRMSPGRASGCGWRQGCRCRASGQQLKCLAVTDEFTKEGLTIDVDGRIRPTRVIEVVSRW
jgi:hypothetical protein